MNTCLDKTQSEFEMEYICPCPMVLRFKMHGFEIVLRAALVSSLVGEVIFNQCMGLMHNQHQEEFG